MYSIGYVMYGVPGTKVNSCVKKWIETESPKELIQYWNSNIMCEGDDISKEYNFDNLTKKDKKHLFDHFMEAASDASIFFMPYNGGGDPTLFFGSEIYSFDCCTDFMISDMLRDINKDEEKYKSKYESLFEKLPKELEKLLREVIPEVWTVFGTS